MFLVLCIGNTSSDTYATEVDNSPRLRANSVIGELATNPSKFLTPASDFGVVFSLVASPSTALLATLSDINADTDIIFNYDVENDSQFCWGAISGTSRRHLKTGCFLCRNRLIYQLIRHGSTKC